MTKQQVSDLSAFRDEVRQAEFVLFDLRAKIRVITDLECERLSVLSPMTENASRRLRNRTNADKLAEFGRLLEKAMSTLEEVIDDSEKLIKDNSHVRPA